MENKGLNIFKVCAIVVTAAIVFGAGLTAAIVHKGITVKLDGAIQTSGKTEADTSSEDTSETEVVIENVTDENGEPVTDESGNDVTEAVTGGTSATEVNGKPSTPAASGVDLSTPQKILDYYAKAIHFASDDGKGLRAGFTVKRSATAVKAPDWGNLANVKIPGKSESAEELANGFIGLKPYDNTFKKGDSDGERRYVALADSKLTLNDIKSASYKKSGNDYILTINVKDGNSQCKNKSNVAKATNNSPIEKCGMCASTSDFSHVHHKNAANIVNTGSGLISDVTESTKDCVVIATIDGQTGKIKNLKVKFTASVDLALTIVVKLGEYSATTAVNVEYSNFKY